MRLYGITPLGYVYNTCELAQMRLRKRLAKRCTESWRTRSIPANLFLNEIEASLTSYKSSHNLGREFKTLQLYKAREGRKGGGEGSSMFVEGTIPHADTPAALAL